MYFILSTVSCRLVGYIYNLVFKSFFPEVVRIETTNACNAKCIICPHPEMVRPIKRMTDDLFFKIIDECVLNKCKEVHLHNFGEPLLDKRLDKFVYYAKSKGIKKVKIFTNGSILSGERAMGLIESGLDEIKISFDGANKEEFERIRTPLKFDSVVNNVVTLVELRNQVQSDLRIKINCCSTSDKSKTMDALTKLVDKFSFSKIHNWGGTSNERPLQGVRKPCSRLWRTFTVLANGDVSLCCLDYDGKEILGNVTSDNAKIATIWKNEKYKRVRDLHRFALQDEIGLCKNCSKAFM